MLRYALHDGGAYLIHHNFRLCMTWVPLYIIVQKMLQQPITTAIQRLKAEESLA